MTHVDVWTLILAVIAGLLQACGLAWAWLRAKSNARTARREREAAIGRVGEGGLTWDQHDHLMEYIAEHLADEALDSYRGQAVMILVGILLGVVASALPIISK